ncbi:MAG: diphosphomevalonate decarboxylase [Saprospiraceae bacterium]|nr:diphosphomevalonate decarboxylase [Saprospiraceae bacterium]
MAPTDVRSLVIPKSSMSSGQVSWRSPSNIALVKYWGKFGNQYPRNPSVSFTLSAAYTETTIQYKPREDYKKKLSISFQFDGRSMPTFEQRIEQYLIGLISQFNFLEQFDLDIQTRNSFPHSSGIASSASGMSALALCLCSIEDHFFQTLQEDQAFRTKASMTARLGSGSACRSIYAHAALWGETGAVDGASNEYAVSLESMLHPSFVAYQDAILLVSREEKSVSSSAGHGLMDHHPFASVRYEQANRNLQSALECLQHGDLERFVLLCEQEAMQLHALMMSSSPYYLLIKPNTLAIIQAVQSYRNETGIPICFTLDAGPNVHLLYPKENKDAVENFINDKLVNYCHQGAWIKDEMGLGPLQSL